MTKRMSKTLAAEIADRTLDVVNPHNRALALGTTLARHGFTATKMPPAKDLRERTALIAWLLSSFAPPV